MSEPTETQNITREQKKPEKTSFSDTTSVPSSVSSVKLLKCPVPSCGATHTKKGKPFLKFGQIRTHWLGKKDAEHSGPFPFTRQDFGLEHKEFLQRIPTPQRSPKHRVYQPEPKGEVPDSLGLLRNQLILYGLSTKNSDAVCDYMRSYHVDDLLALNKALQDVGMARNKKTMFLESWVNARHIPLDYELQEQLDLFREEFQYAPSRPFFNKYGRKIEPEEDIKDDIDKKIDLALDRATKIDMLKRLSSKEEGSDSNQVMELKNEIRDLRQKLDSEREARLNDRLDSLSTKLDEMSKRQGKINNEYGLASRRIESVERILTGLFADLVVDEKPPKRQVISQSKVHELIPEEYRE